MNRILECRTLADEILTKVKKSIKKKQVFLAIISFNRSIYEKLLIAKCLDLDIHFRHYKLDNPTTLEVTSLIVKLNKDIDGVNPVNQYYLSINKPKIINSTVLAVIKILEFYHISLEGKNVTIIGRSYNISKPLASYLLTKDATVTMCHSKTKDLASILKNSDIVISATGVNNLFRSSTLKDNCIVIDIGLGDVLIDSNNVSYTPKIKGVGCVSIAILLENLVSICNTKN